jgi:hypothetical protein
VIRRLIGYLAAIVIVGLVFTYAGQILHPQPTGYEGRLPSLQLMTPELPGGAYLTIGKPQLAVNAVPKSLQRDCAPYGEGWTSPIQNGTGMQLWVDCEAGLAYASWDFGADKATIALTRANATTVHGVVMSTNSKVMPRGEKVVLIGNPSNGSIELGVPTAAAAPLCKAWSVVPPCGNAALLM